MRAVLLEAAGKPVGLVVQLIDNLGNAVLVASLIYLNRLFKNCETVLFDTPAFWATSSIVSFFIDPAPLFDIALQK